MESGHDDESFPGQRFSPMDDELLMFYLKPKVNGMQVPREGDVIFEFDLYGDQDPWTIWKKFEARRANDLRRYKDLYFFTQKKKKGSRASRTVGRGGTWKGQNKGQDVYLLDDQTQKPTSTLLGSKKTYTYKNKGSVHDACWIMYEFELDESQIHCKKQANKNEYVLCLLRNNSKQDDVVLEKKRNRQEKDEILEHDLVEVAIDPESVLEEPQEKRRCLLPCADSVPTSPSLEAEQQHLVVMSDQEFLQSEPFPSSPSENEQAFLQIAMDDNYVGLLTPPMLTEAELQQLDNEEFLQQGQMDMDENMGLLTPSFLDEAELKQLYNEGFLPAAPALEAEASSEVDVCGGNFVDAMVGEGRSMTFMESLMNDEQPNSKEVGEWEATSLDFGYNLAF